MSASNNPLTSPELTAALKSYLPTSLERQCLRKDGTPDPQACASHLAALLRTITTYLPRQVVDPLLAEPLPARVKGDFDHGTVMFADISGFTAMSEKLSRLGKAGAEEITTIVNRFFSALLEITDTYGGDLLKFGGDALLLFFGHQDHALRACRAARQMQTAMDRFSQVETSQGTFRLQMTVGLGSGPLFMAHLGSAEGMEFAIMGPAMAQMARAEDLASAGEIFFDAATYRSLADLIVTDGGQQGFHRLIGFRPDAPDPAGASFAPLPAPPKDPDALPAWLAETVQRVRALELFLPPGLMDRIRFAPERIALGGEYRQVTVLFVNFYGIDEIITSLGPTHAAEITAILNAHFTHMQRILARYGGVVNKVDSYAVGHRIMALFGAPRAHVDDPERAVRAALEMQQAMTAFADLETSCGVFSLKQRIGVNTGLVFAGNVGSLSRQEYSVMGDEVNLTARLMAVAAEGQVLISQSTARQSGGALLLREQEPVRVKGKSKPVPNYEVMGLQERRASEQRPLIGRDDEWQTIHALTDRALASDAQVLTLVGDVGLGKSRLLDEVIAHWDEHGALSLSTTCPSFGRHTPYLPWQELLRDLFGFAPADSNAVKLEKIATLLQEADPTWRDWTSLLGRLLGLEVQELHWMRTLDAQTRQRTLFRLISGLVAHVAGEQPLLLAIDDLQWADDTSVALVNQVARQVTGQALLLALTHRPDESLQLEVSDLPHHTGLRLNELSDEASLRLLEALLPTTPQMPLHLQRLILDKARGNPLFIEEVAHSLIENYLTLDEASGTYHPRSDLDEIQVPDSVNRVIMSRIDRLDEASRNVLRTASAIGRAFHHWLLSAIYPYRHTEGELRGQLDRLSEREILEGPQPDLLYLFRHILTREVAYESLLYADRHALHRRVGESIEAQRAGRLSEYWEVLAYHFGLAEAWPQALDYHLKAGRKAQEIFANQDARHHFQEALRAAEQVPGSGAQQLTAHQRLSEVLSTQGEYNAALRHLYRAQDLAVALDEPPEQIAARLAELCRRTASIHEQKSNYSAAFDWLRGGLILLEGMEGAEAARIYRLGAGVHHRQGNYSAAIDWCRKSLEIAQRTRGREGESVVAHAYQLLGLIHSRLGETERAVQYCRQSLDIYEQIEDITGAAEAHINLGNGYFDQGDWSRATEHYRRALEIKRKVGDVYYQAVITLNLGGVTLNLGDLAQARRYNRQSLEMWQELGSVYAIALLHNNMGAVALHGGEAQEALALLEKSRDLFAQIDSTDFLPEVYRHLAEAHMVQGELDQALSWAQRALDRAREQEMRLEEGASRRVLGQVHRARRELAQAGQELAASRRILEEVNSRYEVAQTLFQLGLLRRDQERSAEAETAFQQAIEIFETLGARLDLAQARAARENLCSE